MSILLTHKVKNEEKLKISLWRMLFYNRKKEDLNTVETDEDFWFIKCSLLITFLE